MLGRYVFILFVGIGVIPQVSQANDIDASDIKMLSIVLDVSKKISEEVLHQEKGSQKIQDALWAELTNRYDPFNDLFSHSDRQDLDYYKQSLLNLVESNNWRELLNVRNLLQKKAVAKAEYILSLITPFAHVFKSQPYTERRPNSPMLKNQQALERLWFAQFVNEYIGIYTFTKSKTQTRKILQDRYLAYKRLYLEIQAVDFLSEVIGMYLKSFGYSVNYIPSDSYLQRTYTPFAIVKEICGVPYYFNNCFSLYKHLPRNKVYDISYRRQADRTSPDSMSYNFAIRPEESPDIGPVKYIVFDQERINQYKTYRRHGKEYVWYKLSSGEEYEKQNTLKIVLQEGKIMSGFVLDLRDSSNFSMESISEIVGMFTGSGAMLRTINKKSNDIQYAQASDVKYTGPMVVITDWYTSYTAEIIAAALKDRKRAVLIGTETAGKGVLYAHIPVNKFLRNINEDYGVLQMGLARLYRVNGLPLDNKPIEPHIKLPPIRPYPITACESGKPGLVQDKIDAREFSVSKKLVAKLRERSGKRVKKSQWFKLAAKYYNGSCLIPKSITLSYAAREMQKKRALKLLTFKKRLMQGEPYIKEALNLLEDMQ